MSLLSELKPIKKSTFSKKRIGRGNSSGWGTTAAKGYKGQKARSGSKSRATFEGGQMPIWQRLPKFGFTSFNKTHFHLVSLDRIVHLHTLLEKSAKDKDIFWITPNMFERHGLIRKQKGPAKVKVLNGRLTLKQGLHIKAHAFSKSAKTAIEAAGGTIEVL